MTDILVVYYSSYGHIEMMANAQAEGARRVAEVQVTVKRVPELVPPEIELRMPTGLELDMCRFQGEHVATITRSLVRGRAAG